MASAQVQSLVATLLNARSIYPWIYDRSGGYNTLVTLTDIINKKGGSKRVTSVDGLYEKYKRGKNNVVQSIAAVAAAGNNLVVTFVDPTYSKFLLKDVVMDANYNLGRVIAVAPGTITIQNYPDASVAMVAATQFLAGQLCKLAFDVSGTYGSFGKDNRIFTPQRYTNYPSNTRASYTLTRADKVETYVNAADGSKFYYFQNEWDMMMGFYKQIEFKYWFSKYGASSSTTVEGEVTGNRGLRQAIIQDGVYMPMASSPTAGNIRDMLSQLGNRNTMSGQKFIALCGRDALTNFQGITQPYIQYTGKNNTFGGEAVRGLNVVTYTIGDVTVDFIVAPILNDTELSEPTTAANATGTRWSNSIYFLNLDDVPSVGGVHMNPAIEKFHFGDKEVLYKGIPGMTGWLGDDTGMGTIGSYQVTASDIDGASIQIETNNGIDVEGYRCGLIELTT